MSFEKYECDGQLDIYEFLPRQVAVKGLLDDGFCPKCNMAFNDFETDLEVCPRCGVLLDWKKWHERNDNHVENT